MPFSRFQCLLIGITLFRPHLMEQLVLLRLKIFGKQSLLYHCVGLRLSIIKAKPLCLCPWLGGVVLLYTSQIVIFMQKAKTENFRTKGWIVLHPFNIIVLTFIHKLCIIICTCFFRDFHIYKLTWPGEQIKNLIKDTSASYQISLLAKK